MCLYAFRREPLVINNGLVGGCALMIVSFLFTESLVVYNHRNSLPYSFGGKSLKSRCWQECVPSGDLRGKLVSLPVLASAGLLHSLVLDFAPCSVPAVQHLPTSLSLSLSIITSPSLTLTFTLLSYKGICDYIGSTWIILYTLHI